MPQTSNELSDFLRSVRGRLSPEDAGVGNRADQHPGSGRRVPGLRREEVASLAGVSVDYYTRLEQGRTKAVSPSVQRAVADALKMNDTEREFFFSLVTAQTEPVRPAPAATVQRVRPGIRRMLATFDDAPAFVIGRGMQILAMNSLASHVLFDMEAEPLYQNNLARWTFLSPEAKQRYVDWDLVASDAAAILRVDAAGNPNDRFVNELIGELTVKSAEFPQMWSDHKVYECTFGHKRLLHPLAGHIDVDYEAFDVPGAPDQKMFVYTAASGSPSQKALDLLASWAADPQSAVDSSAPGLPVTSELTDNS